MDYLDNAATTRPHPEVLRKVTETLESFGNPSSVHPVGMQARNLINEARANLASLFQVPEAGILFCSGGTESINLALKGVASPYLKKKVNLVTTDLEHSAVSQSVRFLEENGLEIRKSKIDLQTGKVNLEHLISLIDSATLLVTLHHVNNETGIIQDLEKIGPSIKKGNPRTLFHVDGVQALGKLPIRLSQSNVDLYSISGHKIHGLKGTGALILNKKLSLSPLLHGGGQEFGLRSGTENVPGIVSLGVAVPIAIKQMEENRNKVETFSLWFRQQIREQIPQSRFFEVPDQVPHITSLSFPGIPGEVLLNHLASQDIYVSQGSACNAKSGKLSPTLQTLGFSRERIKETIRISFSASEIPDNPDAFLGRFISVVRELTRLVV